jgi:predicted kinase
LQNSDTIRVNKDDLRAMLRSSVRSKENEKFVLKIRDFVVEEALKIGQNVIVDDTNLNPKHKETIITIAKKYDAIVEEKSFLHVPLDEFIKRDIKRVNSVGESVIKKMYRDYIAPKIEPRKYNKDLSDVIICDLDGTLCLFGDDNPYERDFLKDEVIIAVLDVLNRYIDDPKVKIMFISGRNDRFRDVTIEWLKNNILSFEKYFVNGKIALDMRKDGDVRKDSMIKKEMFMNNIDNKYNVLFVLDDRQQVVDLWRNELGLTVFQVAEGNF